MIIKLISRKITIVSLLAMIIVIYMHSFNFTMINTSEGLEVLNNGMWNFNIFFQNFISDGIGKIAVPLFFIISGFLFFKNFDMDTYRNKVYKRMFTLFVPYVFWSSFVVMIFFILQSIPGLTQFFNRDLIKDLPFQNILYIIFIDPKNYPLWFLRDLIALVVISPILFYFVKNFRVIYFTILLLLWFSNNFNFNFPYFTSEPLLFFSFGAYLVLVNQDLLIKKASNRQLVLIAIMYFVILICKTILSSFFYTNNDFVISLLSHISVLVGIPFLWLLTDYYLVENKILYFLSTFTFLFYVFQEPVITILKKLGFVILGKNAYSSLSLYILIPVFTILFLILLGAIMQKYIPKISKIITGNRL